MKKQLFTLFLMMMTLGLIVSCENPNTEIEEVTEDPNGEDNGGGNSGGGSGGKPEDRDKRYTVMEFIKNNYNVQIWVRGYIVGACANNIKYAEFTPPFEQSSAILLADRPGQTDTDSIISIQLKTGVRRNLFNLVDHPENLGCIAEFFGSQKTYLGIAGMKDDIGSWHLYDKDGKLVE